LIELTPPKTVKLVPIELLRDLARIALDVIRLTEVHIRDKSGRTRREMLGRQRRLEREARTAIDLFNTTPSLFGDDAETDAAAAEPEISAEQVAAWLTRFAEQRTFDDPLNPRPPHEQEVAEQEAYLIGQTIEILEDDDDREGGAACSGSKAEA